MSKPRFSILHTSARPDKWRAIYDAWLSNCDRPEDVEYVLVVDRRWGFTPESVENTFPARKRLDVLEWNEGYRNYVSGVNTAAEEATGDILIVVADDQFPCEHWDARILEALNIIDPAEQILLAVSTGTPDEFERGIVVMPIMSRALYENWGYVFYPEYESMLADNDLCEHAKQDRVLVEARHLMFPHKHPSFDKTGWTGAEFGRMDAAYQAQNSQEAYEIGWRTIQQRRANRFGSVVRDFGRIGTGRKPSLLVCVPGETFSRAWVEAWTALLPCIGKNFDLRGIVFGYSSSPDTTRQGIREDLMKTRADYVLWIDDDNLLSPEQLLLMLQDLEEHPEIAMVAGWAWEADHNLISAGMFIGKDKLCGRIEYHTLMDGPHDLFRVEWSGFPGVFMRYKLLEAAGAKAFVKIPNEIAPWYAYGEDISFCMRVQEHLLVIDRRIRLPHLKLRDNQPTIPPKQGRMQLVSTPEAKEEVFESAGVPA